jgi:hypothetical protein
MRQRQNNHSNNHSVVVHRTGTSTPEKGVKPKNVNMAQANHSSEAPFALPLLLIIVPPLFLFHTYVNSGFMSRLNDCIYELVDENASIVSVDYVAEITNVAVPSHAEFLPTLFPQEMKLTAKTHYRPSRVFIQIHPHRQHYHQI